MRTKDHVAAAAPTSVEADLTWTLPVANGHVDSTTAEFANMRSMVVAAVKGLAKSILIKPGEGVHEVGDVKGELTAIVSRIVAPSRGELTSFLFDVGSEVKKQILAEGGGVDVMSAYYLQTLMKVVLRDLAAHVVTKPDRKAFFQRLDRFVLQCVDGVIGQVAASFGGMQPLDFQVELIETGVVDRLVGALRDALYGVLASYF